MNAQQKEMKITELIAQLQAMLDTHGDINVILEISQRISGCDKFGGYLGDVQCYGTIEQVSYNGEDIVLSNKY